MQRLTKYEMLTLISSALLLLVALVGYFTNVPWLLDIPVLLLIFLIIPSIVMVIVRLDRVMSGQKRAREEIYQVLYTLHGNDKLTESQAGKTRDLIRRNHKALLKGIEQGGVQEAVKERNDQGIEGDDIARIEENERLRYNKLIGLLDAQWTLLDSLRQSNEREN